MRDVAEALAVLRAVARVERTPAGVDRPTRQYLSAVVERHLLEAAAAGATVQQLAEAVDRSEATIATRLRRARLKPHVVQPQETSVPTMAAPKVLRPVPRCGRPLPPPSPAWALCGLDRGHAAPCQR